MPLPDWLVALQGLPNAPPTNLHFAATNIENLAYNWKFCFGVFNFNRAALGTFNVMKGNSNEGYFSLTFTEYPVTKSDTDVYHVGFLKFLIGSLFAENFTNDIDLLHVV